MKRLQTLALEQKEDARHGDATFPIQKYITSLKPDYPVITTHWHEEAEFTLITEGDASYQIDLTSYGKDDLIFILPLLLHSVSRGQSALYQSETYVFHMNFLGGNATDICSTRYLMPLTNEELSVPCLIRPTHPAYVSLRKIFAQISSLFANPVEGYELAIKALLLQVIFLLLQNRTPDGKRSVDTANASEKLKPYWTISICTMPSRLRSCRPACPVLFQRILLYAFFQKTHEHDRSGIPQQSSIGKGCRTV